MKRWAVILGCALCVFGAGCSGDEPDGSGSAGSGAGAGAGTGGTGGTRAGTGGTAGAGGSGGLAGTGVTAGAGGAGGSSGESGGGAGGSSGASGAAGASGAGGEGGIACGSRGLPECEGGSFCDFPPEADCGRSDGAGTCHALTDVACGEIYLPVCGCDNVTYSSSCHAYQAGMSIDYEGECTDTTNGGHTCVPPDGVACLIAPPECLEGEVPAYDINACGGTCVPIEQCDCAGPEDCPYADMYTCHMSAGHCGPFVN